MVIKRPTLLKRLRASLKRSRVIALIGPRQCGKTTLARELVAPESIDYFDLEDPPSLARLDAPDTALRDLKGLVVIDEIPARNAQFARIGAPRQQVVPVSFFGLNEAGEKS